METTFTQEAGKHRLYLFRLLEPGGLPWAFRVVRNGETLEMTGELTLTGSVLAVGGIREKLVAVKRVGIDEAILPEANRGDYEDLPEYIRQGLTIHFAARYRDVADIVFAE